MAVIDIDKLLNEVSADNPCGENLKHDPSFMDLATAAKGRPEQVMGDAVKPAQDPDWDTVQKLAVKMFASTKDLRVAVYLVTALLHNKGIAGLSTGLTLLHKMLDQYWDNVHPELDPDDDNDPTLRMNCLEALNDPDGILAKLKLIPLVSMQGIGQFSIKDIDIASGKIAPPSDPEYVAPNSAVIEGVFRDCDISELQSIYDVVDSGLKVAMTIASLLNDKVGVQNAANLSGLVADLKGIYDLLKEQLTMRGAIEMEADAEGADKSGSNSMGSLTGEVNNRADVIRLLDKICNYYQKNEPSSPVPLMLKRAKRLVNMNFMEIMQDLVADAVKQAEKIVGVDNTE